MSSGYVESKGKGEGKKTARKVGGGAGLGASSAASPAAVRGRRSARLVGGVAGAAVVRGRRRAPEARRRNAPAVPARRLTRDSSVEDCRHGHRIVPQPEAEDSLATGLALFVIFVVPVVLIALFWMVHILPEKIAHQRHHPQFEAIRTLCLLSLVFGGLLWPIAWLWAYSKPVMHKIAYGTDKATPEVDEEGSAWDADKKPAAARPAASRACTTGSHGSKRR